MFTRRLYTVTHTDHAYIPMPASAFATCSDRVKPRGPVCTAVCSTSRASVDSCSSLNAGSLRDLRGAACEVAALLKTANLIIGLRAKLAPARGNSVCDVLCAQTLARSPSQYIGQVCCQASTAITSTSPSACDTRLNVGNVSGGLVWGHESPQVSSR